MIEARPQLLITDLDNTLWDWFDAWYVSFTALLNALVEQSGVPRDILEAEIKAVHQRRGTTEYSNLVREVPALVAAAAPLDPAEVYDAALHAQNSARRAATRLYPGVLETLQTLKTVGTRVVAYTESGAFWTEWRIRRTGLDGVIDVLYSAPDHDLIAGVETDALRTGHYGAGDYGLKVTEHRHVPYGVLKPNEQVLRAILEEQAHTPNQALYIGDSLMKDIAMAQSAGVLDVHAAYGLVQHKSEYDLLKRVTHWPEQEVTREESFARPDSQVVPTHVLRAGFGELLSLLKPASAITR